MIKKRIFFIALFILLLFIFLYFGYRIADNIAHKRVEYKENRRIVNELLNEMAYEIQNKAFFGVGFIEFTPYNKKYEYSLQINILLYTKDTMKVITLSDVETFLATSENRNGTPRTWEDDETGIIKDFVGWCLEEKNSKDLKIYRSDLQVVLVDYCIQNPECPYTTLSKLTPEQIIELDKKYTNQNYDLLLEW